MPKLTPQEASAKWARNAQAGVSDYQAGVERVTEAPTAKAAEAQVKMLQNLTQAVTSGRWATALRAVGLEEWKVQTVTKGVQRYGPGVQASVAKQEAYYREVFPVIERLQAEIDAMPNLTIEDSINRAATFMRGMHAFKQASR